MTRSLRQALSRRPIALALLGGLVALLGWLAPAVPAVAKPPNIVFILTDDLDSAAAATMERMQALITAPGMSFRRHYVNVSLCCPSRVSTLRGQFSQNTTIISNDPPLGGFEGFYAKGLEASTAATWLQAAGYRTALIGKYVNGYPNTAPSATYIPPGWTEWFVTNGGDPYKEFNYSLNENGVTVSYGAGAADYLTDVISARATDFIRRSVEEHPEQPFFAYVATYAPHLPATPAPRHKTAFPGIQAPRTPSFNEADVRDKPTWLRNTPLLTPEQIGTIDAQYRSRRQSLLAVDEMVQAIVDTLQSTGQLDSTYVFFASDNGFHQGQHRMTSGKMSAFEEDLIVPLSVRGPGVAAGSVVDALSANVDYAPTFAELAGAELPSWVDGRSLVPFLRGQTPESWRQAMLFAHQKAASPPNAESDKREPADPFDTAGYVIRDFAGIRTAEGQTYLEYDTGECELYNNDLDPDQLKNRCKNAKPKLKARLSGWLAALRNAAGPALRDAELKAP